MKIFCIECFDDEIKEEIKKEVGVSYSSKFDVVLMSDETFKVIDNKYKVIENKEEYCLYVYKDLKDWAESYFDGEIVEFFNKTYYLSEFVEGGLETFNYMLEKNNNKIISEDWAEEIEGYLKTEAMVYISSKLEDELLKLNNDGYDINILKNIFTNFE